MCGIAGFWQSNSNLSPDQKRTVAGNMSAVIRHRGPDAEGIWDDNELYLIHRRLAIIDVSESGNQPMLSNNSRYVIIYNGEIYNANQLRQTLQSDFNSTFKGHSDTEVLIEAISVWGIDKTLQKINGMFAFALWDKSEKILYLARDRVGKKPIYWGRFGDLFLFGSELKALREHPGWRPEVNRDVLASFMRHNYILHPHTIYKDIYKLPQGSLLIYPRGGEPKIKKYWDMSKVVSAGLDNKLEHEEDRIISETEKLLEDAVVCRMVSDVPLGAFLSGGIDSSTVVALMQKNSMKPIRTFSIGFGEKQYNEARYAGEVAKHLGTDHTEFYVSPEDAMSVIPELPEIFDEPFSDSSQIPTYLVSRLTRQYVTVALSGDGGDEVFAGYNRYLYAARVMHRLGMMPDFANRLIRRIINSITQDKWNNLASYLPPGFRIPGLGDKLYKLADIAGKDRNYTYRKLVSHWHRPEEIVLHAKEPDSVLLDEHSTPSSISAIEQMQFLDTMTYLPDDILTKVDRATMAVSLEARAPFLDYRLLEHAWRLPLSVKIRKGQGKWILQQILHRYVPKKLVDRPKMGFGMPVGEWLRDPLRNWAESLLDKEKILEQGYLNYSIIKQRWDEHLSGQKNWQYHLWDVLMFQAWLQRWMK